VLIGQTLANATKFRSSRSAKRCTRNVLQKNYPLTNFGASGGHLGLKFTNLGTSVQQGPRSINVPNFVPFWQPVSEISVAKLRWFRWQRDRQTVNDMSLHTMRR